MNGSNRAQTNERAQQGPTHTRPVGGQKFNRAFVINTHFCLKPHSRKLPAKLLTFLDINWSTSAKSFIDPVSSFVRHGAKPKCLQTHRNVFGNAQTHPSNKSKHVNTFEKQFSGETLSSKVNLIWHRRPICK